MANETQKQYGHRLSGVVFIPTQENQELSSCHPQATGRKLKVAAYF
jgi:hypothetical protein